MQPDDEKLYIAVALVHLALRLIGNDPLSRAVLFKTVVDKAKEAEGNTTPVEAETTIQ